MGLKKEDGLNFGASGGNGGGGGSATATINFFEGTTGTTLDTQLTLGNAVMVFKNGVLLQPTEDYTISSSTITFVTALEETDKIAVINGNLNTIDLTPYQKISTTIKDTSSSSISFSSSSKVKANTDYEFGELSSLTFGSSSVVDSNLGATIRFTSGATATTITDSASIDWSDGGTPIPSANKTCLIFIWNNIGFYKEW